MWRLGVSLAVIHLQAAGASRYCNPGKVDEVKPLFHQELKYCVVYF